MYIFVTGGYRSGRSNYALRRGAEFGPPPWLYVANGAQASDAIRKRIENHRRDSEAIWRTIAIPQRLALLLDDNAAAGAGALVFDGATAWLQGRLASGAADADAVIFDEVAGFADRLYRSAVPAVVVSTEMTFAPAPEKPEQQRFANLLARTNQILAQQASAVVLMVSGIPLKVR